jgi:hypothetical protein
MSISVANPKWFPTATGPQGGSGGPFLLLKSSLGARGISLAGAFPRGKRQLPDRGFLVGGERIPHVYQGPTAKPLQDVQ